MICKEVNYKLAIDEWQNLLDSGSLTPAQKRVARIHLAGLRAEKDTAYHLAARFQADRELLVFNNLKFPYGTVTAQIDHLVLSRWSAYFIETKSVGETLNINADGRWARRRGRRYDNFNESPVAQSQRHESVLFDLLESRLPEFMGTMLGVVRKTFRKIIKTHHLVAISSDANIEGRGKHLVKQHLKHLDEIPQFVLEDHQAVRSSLLGSVFAELLDSKTKKRDPAFTPEELEAARQLLLKVDTAPTPLKQAHEFIAGLAAEAAETEEEAPEAAAPAPASPRRAVPPVAPPSPVAPPVLPASPAPAKQERPAAPPRAAAAAPAASEPAVPSPVAPSPSSADAPAPVCPRCGSAMVLRVAKRGERSGKQFYGCSTYPQCREIINLA